MSRRKTLPTRRAHEVMSFRHRNLDYVVGIGRPFEGGPIEEVFINCGKAGTDGETLARDSAVILSIALQYGAPVDVLRHAITRDVNGAPSGPVGVLLDKLGKQ